jgi:hypothetical protein
MKNNAVLVVLLFLSAAALVALGKKEQKTKPGEEPPLFRDRNGPVESPREKTMEEIAVLPLVRVSGRVRLISGGTMNRLVITGTDGEWHIEEKDQEPFLRFQQQTVSAEGRLDVQETRLAGSNTTVVRSLLRDAKIIPSETAPDL